MKLHFLFYFIAFYFELGASFFLLETKSIYFCLKVCPLYCSKREKRDTGPYWEDDDEIPYLSSSYHEEPYHSYHHHPRFVYCKPWSTTPKPTTEAPTTESPKGICLICEKKCGFQLPQ